MELIASELLTAMLTHLNSASLSQLQAIAAEALDPMFTRCATRRECLAAIVLARRLPMVIATGDVAEVAPLERKQGHRMLEGSLPQDEPLSLTGLLQEVLGYDAGLVPSRGGCAAAGKQRSVWRDVMRLQSSEVYNLWSVALGSALLERMHVGNEFPGHFGFLNASGWVVRGCVRARPCVWPMPATDTTNALSNTSPPPCRRAP